MALRHPHREPDVVRITTAPISREAELSHRERRYVISMTIRTLCFVAAIAVGPGWFRWVLVAASFVLPYVAVVMANSEGSMGEAPGVEAPGPTRSELEQAHPDE